MKKLNFNFKSIVKRKTRWLLTLIAILTLGVGQMWASKTVYLNTVRLTRWEESSARFFVQSGGTRYELTAVAGKSHLYSSSSVPDGWTTVTFERRNSANNSTWNSFSGNVGTQNCGVPYDDGDWDNGYMECYYPSATKVYIHGTQQTGGDAYNIANDNARIWVYYFSDADGTSNNHVEATVVETISSVNRYVATIPAGTWHGIIVVRTRPSTDFCWNGDNFWGQTENKYFTTGKNLATQDNGWSVYCPIKKTSVINDNSTVTYGGNGGSSTPYKVEKGGTIKVSASSTDNVTDGNMTTKYAFYVGASNNQDGTGTTYSYTASASAGQTHQLKVNSYNYYNSTSSTAKYSSILYYTTITCYTVTYNKNGASDGTIPAVSGSKYESGTNVTLATNTGSLAKDGYSFNGWNTDPDGEGTHYDAGGTLSSIGANTILYAEWSATPSLTVTHGSHISTTTGSVAAVTLGSSYSISASNFDTGYEFDEWTASPAGNASFTSSTSASTSVTVSNGSVTVTANAKPTTYSINYAGMDGATNFDGAPASYTIESSTIVLGTPTKDHYHFDGWTLGGSPVTQITAGSTGNKTLTANWTKLPMVYLRNTMNWANAYISFYKAGGYWDSSNPSKGSGSDRDASNYVADPAAMTYNSSTGLFEYECPDVYTYTYACFTKDNQADYDNFYNTEAIYCNNTLQYEKMLNASALTTSTHNGTKYYTSFTFDTKADGTGWFIPGGWSSWETKTTECSWNTSPNVRFSKSLAANTSYEFKIYNHGSYYGLNSSATWSESGNKTLVSGQGNCTLSTTIAGAYTFDFNTSTKVLTISYPEVYAVSGDFNSWTETTNLDFSGNDGTYEVDIDASPTNYEFKVLNHAIWYGHADKTFTESESNVQAAKNSSNINLTADIYPSGSYTFAFNKSTNKLGVTYPDSYNVTFGQSYGGAATTATANSVAISSNKKIVAAAAVVFTHGSASTGYQFKGWYDNESGTGDKLVAGNPDTYTISSLSAEATVYAVFEPRQYAITFDATTNGGAITSGSSPQNVVFDETSVGSCPTATKDGYCFDGWYTKASDGKKVVNADGTLVANVTDESQYTGAGGAWKKPSATTVYAVYTVPTIEMSASPAVLNVKKPEKDTVVIHQTFSCTPTGTYNVVYTVGYSANHTQLAPQPTIIYGTAGYDSIVMPMASANTYEIVAELRTGSTPGSGTLLKRDTINYAVEDEYSVTLHYMVDGVQIRSSRTVSAYPSATETPLDVRVFIEESGYVLDHWELGVGIDTVDGRGSIIDGGSAGPLQSKYIYASNNGNIYLHYKPKTNTVYFFNTFDKYWYSTIMKKYDYGTTGYWTTGNGAGANGKTSDTIKMATSSLEEMRWMAAIGGSTTMLAFTTRKMDGSQNFWGLKEGGDYTTNAPGVIYRTDYNAATPMFVPVSKNVDEDYYILNQNATGEAHYYRGFWVKYSPNPDSTGYYLHVYNQKAQSGAELIQTLPLRLSQTGADGTWELRAVMDLEGGKTYGFKITKATGASTKTWYSYNGTLTAADHEGKVLDGTSDNIGLTTTSAGDYTFHVFCKDFGTKEVNTASASEVQGQLAVTVDYATVSGDYRVIYKDATQTEWIASPSIHPVANGQDTVSFFIRKSDASRVMKIQKYDTNWADFGDPVDLSSITKDSVYVIYLQQNEAMTSIEATGIDFYSGDFYIRTDCVDEHKWDYKQSLDNHRMNASDYGMSETQPVQFTHYYVHWVDANQNVKFVVANKYAPCISDTLITDAYANVAGGNLPNAGASVRFMYNKGTNNVARAYLAGAQGGAYTPNYLKLRTSTDSLSKATGDPAPIDSITFTDLKNFVYQAEIKAKPGLTATLTAQYNGNTQYFKGSELEEEEILGGTTTAWQSLLLTYDFKVNRLICAWQPSGDSIEGNTPINADVMIIRTGQEAAQQIIFKNNDSKLSSVKYIYGVMQFNYDDMVGHMYTWGPTAYELCMYYISFPYDVLVNDIMAPGRMGTEWRIQRYNGAKRAKGWFAGDGVTTFWEDVQSGDTLHAYEGYSLLLNRRIFNDGSSSVWANKGAHSKLYMYFPSKDATTGVVANKTVEVTVPSHECTVDRVFDQDMDKPEAEQRNHKIVDSHWNMIGTPLFENHTAATIVTGPTIEGETLQYIYAWNPAGNSLGIQNTLGTSWEFKTMYSYMAQYAGTITFTGSAVGDVVAAPRRTPKENYTLNLELTKDEMFIGRTYVELRENAVDSFLLNEDVYMVKNGVTADLYTFAGAYEAGANVMSVGSHTIPVGVDVKTAGTYTFSMPDNFDGTVTLIDTYAQTRTNLNIEDYEVTLNKGTINDRFFLEIDIANAPTAIDGASDGQGTLKDGKAHKFIMNDQMYILKDGVIYDARGSRVK